MTDKKKQIPFPKASLNKENGQIAWGHNSYEWYSPGYFITQAEAEEFMRLRADAKDDFHECEHDWEIDGDHKQCKKCLTCNCVA